jgi:hypothetical protein
MGMRHAFVISGPSDPALPVDEVDWNAAHVIDDYIDFPAIASPAAPGAGNLRFFAKSFAGRNLPTIRGPSGVETPLQPFFGRNKIGLFMPLGNGGTDSQVGVGVTATGTAQTTNVATTNFVTYMRRREWAVTTAATTAVAGIRGNAQQFGLGGTAAGLGGFFFIWRWGVGRGGTISTHRGFAGMRASTAAPTNVEPSSLTNMIGMGWDAADTNIQFMRNDGTGSATKIDLGASFAVPAVADATMYEIAMFAPPGTTQSLSYLVTDLVTGATATGTVTTDLPATSQLLNPYGFTSVGGTSSVIGFVTAGFYVETDN